MSSDPSDLLILTLGDFFLSPLTCLRDVDLTQAPSNCLTRLQLLQQRSKWTQASTNPTVDQLALIKDMNLPHLEWLFGRLEAVHPGKNSVVRVATIRMKEGSCQRISKLCSIFCPVPESLTGVS